MQSVIMKRMSVIMTLKIVSKLQKLLSKLKNVNRDVMIPKIKSFLLK
jgi:hypothetical protein